MEKKKKGQVFRDPLYGYINIKYDIITKIIDTAAFQRLRRIKQLSGVQMVYHGAEHSRFSHSLGVYAVSTMFLRVNDLKDKLTEREQLLFMITALLHDIGHGPYSHAFEEVFQVDHELIGANIITKNKELREVLDSIDDKFAQDISGIILKVGHYPLIEQLISSQLDVDRLDYLGRDAYYTGATYGKIDLDRLIRVMEVVDNKVTFRKTGIHAIENYLISRYHMYWQVYYHPTSRAYEIILEKIYLRVKDLLNEDFDFIGDIKPLKGIIKDPFDLKCYMIIDDFYINGLISSFLRSDDKILRELANDFMNRSIWSYLDDTNENKGQINKIINAMSINERRYYTKSTTVYESTYNDKSENVGDQIYILLEDNSISTLSKESKIIDSLSYSGSKTDKKFFYKEFKK